MFSLPPKKLVLPLKKLEPQIDFSEVQDDIDNFNYKEPEFSSQEDIIAQGDNWQILVDTLNFILKTDNRYTYYSDLDSLLKTLFEHRIKYHLTYDKMDKIVECIQDAHKDILIAIGQMTKGLKYLGDKYGVKN